MKTYRKWLIASVLIFMTMSVILPLKASAQKPLSFHTQTPRVRLNNTFLQMPDNYQQPIVDGDIVLVPLRVVIEALGFSVEWDAQAQAVYATRQTYTLFIQIGGTEIMVNGVAVSVDTPAQIMNSRAMVPWKMISLTGVDIHWDEINLIVDIWTCNELWPTSTRILSPLTTYIDGFTLGMNPEDLVQMLGEKGIDIIPSSAYQTWELIYQYVENPVRDGRVYNEGGDFSFTFLTRNMLFAYTREGIQKYIHVISPHFRTSTGIGIGDSRDAVIAAYGVGYEENIVWDVIEYFDGESYLFFVFSNNMIYSWGIGRMTIFESLDR